MEIGNFGVAIVLGTVLAAGWMTLLWARQLKTKNAGIVDLGWTAGLVIVCFGYACFSHGWLYRRLLFFALVFLWGARLFKHLWERYHHEKSEDKRYAQMRKKFGEKDAPLQFLWVFYFQALTIGLLSGIYWVIMQNPMRHFQFLDYAAIFLWVIGFVGESVADRQLRDFKMDASNKGKVCDRGLWNYSRHPNYFFECVIWVSYFVWAMYDVSNFWVIYSPAMMICFILFFSGIPPAEAQSLLSRGDLYRKYQKETSVFIPWFKRIK